MPKSKITKRVVGVGAALAVGAGIGLATATPANADTWDKVAQCESGGNASTNTGNGFHGAFQFTPSTWKANGGKGSAENASMAQQKNVARSVLKSQGPGAWPVCGKKAGLTKSNGGAKTNAGTGNHTKSASNHTQSSHNTKSTSNHTKSSNNNGWKSHKSSSNNSSNNNWKNHKSSSNNSSNNWKSHQQNSNNNNGSKSYSSHQQSTHKSYSPKHSSGNTTKSTANYTPKHAKGNGHTVTVKSGDTLGTIAKRYGVNWHKLYNVNKGKISNPNVIYAGQTLELA